MSLAGWLVLLTLAALMVAVFPLPRLRRLYVRWRDFRNRATLEDALKHLLAREQQGVGATPESVAGALGISPKRTLKTLLRLESLGLLHSSGGRIFLSKSGESRAKQVVRAHRLWETYLAADARVPLEEVHDAAERVEHQLSEEELARLEAHLGHPRLDPHGDPIPDAQGRMDSPRGTPLADWPTGTPARVMHLEDEPSSVFSQIPGALRRTGNVVEVEQRSGDSLVIRDGEDRYRVSPLVAGNIHVEAVPESAPSLAGLLPLTDLKPGEEGEVICLGPALQGLTRRRLLDLGLTPGARVQAYLRNPFGDPHAYKVRGTLLALRRDQSSQVWVRRLTPESEPPLGRATFPRRSEESEGK